MARVSVYLNFEGNAEEAFNYYKTAFKTEFSAPIARMKDVPSQPGMPALPEKETNAVMHVVLPILGGTVLQGTDMLESMGHKLKIGNNTTICLEPDSKEETDRKGNRWVKQLWFRRKK
jgi:PhnB protein